MNISISLLILLVFCCFSLFSIHLTKRIPKKSIRFLNHNHLDNHWSNFKFKHAKNYKNSFHETFRYLKKYYIILLKFYFFIIKK
jgi:cell division protein FtsL